MKKSKGYWQKKENVLSEALKYKTRKEFISGCKSAYNSALSNGWIDEVSAHFNIERNNYDIKQKINIVYSYEFQELNYCYVGRTINLHERDMMHRRGHKSHGIVRYDSLKRFCIEHSVEMPSPIVKYENLDAIESLRKEEEVLNEYISNGWNMINQGKVGVGSGSLGGFKKWNKDTCREFCKSFKTMLEVRNANWTCYKECAKNGWFEEFGISSSQETPMGFWNDYDNCLNEASKYSSISDLQFHRYGCYLGIIRNGWRKMFDEIYFNDSVRKWTYVACKEEAKKYSSKVEMKKANQSAYVASVKRGWIDEFFANQKLPNGYWNDFNNVKAEALKWKSAREFARHGKGAYNAAKRNGWLGQLEYKNE